MTYHELASFKFSKLDPAEDARIAEIIKTYINYSETKTANPQGVRVFNMLLARKSVNPWLETQIYAAVGVTPPPDEPGDDFFPPSSATGLLLFNPSLHVF